MKTTRNSSNQRNAMKKKFNLTIDTFTQEGIESLRNQQLFLLTERDLFTKAETVNNKNNKNS